MNIREQPPTIHLGKPIPGTLTTYQGRPAVPLHRGNGVTEWFTTEQDARDLAAAAQAIANILGSEATRGLLSGAVEERFPDRPAAPEATGLMPAVQEHHVPPWAATPRPRPLLPCSQCGGEHPADDRTLSVAISTGRLPDALNACPAPAPASTATALETQP